MEYPPETGGGGIGSYLVSVAPALAAQGHTVHVISCAGGQAARDYESDGVTIHRRGLLEVRGLGRLRAPHTVGRIRAGLSTFRAFRELKSSLDVIEYPDWAAEGWLFGLLRPTPLVAQLHTPLALIQRYNAFPATLDVRMASFLERLSVHRADLVSAPSQLLVSALRAIGWLRNRQVELVPYAIDWMQWADLPDAGRAQPTVLCLGRLEPRKAPELLADAIGLLRAELPGARALFVGRCTGTHGGIPYATWIRALAANPASGCEHVDQVPRDELRAIFGRVRAVAVPSRFDNYAVVVLEAMAAGRPVVVSDATGSAAFVRESGGGAVVPAGDATALAHALRPFLKDPDYARAVGQMGQAAVRTHLDPARIAHARADLFQRAFTLRRGRA